MQVLTLGGVLLLQSVRTVAHQLNWTPLEETKNNGNNNCIYAIRNGVRKCNSIFDNWTWSQVINNSTNEKENHGQIGGKSIMELDYKKYAICGKYDKRNLTLGLKIDKDGDII